MGTGNPASHRQTGEGRPGGTGRMMDGYQRLHPRQHDVTRLVAMRLVAARHGTGCGRHGMIWPGSQRVVNEELASNTDASRPSKPVSPVAATAKSRMADYRGGRVVAGKEGWGWADGGRERCFHLCRGGRVSHTQGGLNQSMLRKYRLLPDGGIRKGKKAAPLRSRRRGPSNHGSAMLQ